MWLCIQKEVKTFLLWDETTKKAETNGVGEHTKFLSVLMTIVQNANGCMKAHGNMCVAPENLRWLLANHNPKELI